MKSSDVNGPFMIGRDADGVAKVALMDEDGRILTSGGTELSEAIVILDTSRNASLATGQNESISLIPPVGKIGILQSIGFYVGGVGEGVSGNHQVILNYEEFNDSTIKSLLSQSKSANEEIFVKWQNGFTFTHDVPLVIGYENFGNVTQNSTRFYYIAYTIRGI